MPVAPQPLPPDSSKGPTGARHVRRLDKDAADERLEAARTALRAGDLEGARTALVRGLEHHPGKLYLYREVGTILSRLGLPELAEQCFRGRLPDVIAEQWFPGRQATVTPTPAASVADRSDEARPVGGAERHVCHEPRVRELRAPKGIRPLSDPMFRVRTMTSTHAVVDHVRDGALWFDGFNRALYDGAGNLIEGQMRGTPALMRAVVEEATPHRIDGRAFFVGSRGFNNYYHWMLDILPSMALFEKAGFELCPEDRVVVFTGRSGFQKGTLAHLGVAPEQVIEMSRVSPYVSASEMIVPFFPNGMAMMMGDWVPEFLRERFLGGTPPALPPMPRIYLARARNARNGRAIANEPAVIEFLEAHGFSTVYPEDYSVPEQGALFMGAETVIASHGAGLANIAFCRPGTTVIELYGDHMERCYWALSEIGGLDYYNHCCNAAKRSSGVHRHSHENIHERRQRGFSVDLGELDALLEAAGVR